MRALAPTDLGGSLDEGVAREAGDALADLVALDLGGAAGDGHPAVHEHERVAHEAGAVPERRVGAVELGEDGGRLVADLGEEQLGHGAIRAGATSLHAPVGAAGVDAATGLVGGGVST